MRRTVVLLAVVVAAGCTGSSAPRPSGTTEASARQVVPSGLVAVPDVVGLTSTQAVAAMDAAGLPFEIRPVGGDSGRVTEQTPAAASVVEPATIVVVSVECYAAPCPKPATGVIYDPCTCANR